MFFRFFRFVSLEMSLFPSIVRIVAVFSLYGEDVVRFSFPGGVYLPCDHGLDFFTPANLCENSINQSNQERGQMQHRE